MSISHRFGRSTAWIVDRPGWAYLFLIVMSAIATVGYVDPERVRNLFLPHAKDPLEPVASSVANTETPKKPRPNVEALEMTRSDAILVIESDDVFTPSGAKALRAMISSLEAIPYVRNLLWMDRVPVLNIFGLREPLFPKSEASPARFVVARERALKHPLVKGQLLSPDGRTLIVLVNFDWLYVTSDEDCSSNLRKTAESALAEFPDVKFTVGVTGQVPIRLTMMQTHERNNLKFRVIGYGVVILMAAVLFRGVVSVVILSLGPILGIFWTIGFLNFFHLQDNPFNDVVLPVMLSLVGLADGVHMMVQIRRFHSAGMGERDAARAGLQEVGLACFLTSITTSIGFWSLTLAQHEIVKEFGWSCVLGVILTVFAILIVIPLAYLSRPAKFLRTLLSRKILGIRLEPIEQQEGFIERHLHRVVGFVDLILRYPKPVAWVGIVVTVVCAMIAMQLRPDERRSSFLPESAEATKALHQMDKALGGLEFSEVRIHWSSNVASDSTEVLKVVTQVDELLKSEPLIGTPLSIRSLLDALPGDSPTEERASMIELLPPPLKRAFYKPEDQYATVTFRVLDIGIAKYSTVFQRIETGLAQVVGEHPEFRLDLAGSAIHRWRNLYRIALDMGSSLGSETIIIICVLGIVFRSVRIGLIAMVPNIFPLVICATWMVFTGQPLEIVTVCCFTICLGIAVDDTIHFLTRFQEELPRSTSRKQAIRRTFEAVGTSMLMTTMVLVAGFFTVTFSDLRDQRIFASMGVLTMITAMVGDLVFLPAILAVYTVPAPGETAVEKDRPTA
ncbi:efflux RND transporter permease subunit [Schlesneria paludicola]|uniref:efflux RND transporter permease subunit n=1 Tax=Schlesneria paludicola TaxID=360056 RepID=UPI00138B023C|nr:MMPL family transporter [Schlesneria paludicola]